MLNRVELIGNLARDPELRFSSDGTPYCYLRVITDRRAGGEKVSDYHFVVVWRDLATRCSEFLALGHRVFVEGRLEINAYAKPDGSRVERPRIVASRVIFLSGPSRRETNHSERSSDNGPTHIRDAISCQTENTEHREPVEEPA